MAQAASFSVILEAQNNLKAVLGQANGMIKQSTAELKKASEAQSKMGTVVDNVKAKVFSFKGGLLALGAAALAAAKPLFEFAKEGAKLADQLDFVGDRVHNMEAIIAQTREATGGMVDDAQIVQGIALMDSFGLEIEKMPELYEQASKASLRTGDSMEMLLDSAVRGIARLSPRIVDNMGIQVELAQATQVAAERFGIQAEAVDETQKKAGLLSIVLKELGSLNKDINLNKSRVRSMKSLETAFSNFKNSMARDWADLFTSTGDKLEKFAHISAVALNRAETNWNKANAAILKGLKAVGEAEEDLAKLQLSKSREVQVQTRIAIEQRASAQRLALSDGAVLARFQADIDATQWTNEKGLTQIREGMAAEQKRLFKARASAQAAAGAAEKALLKSNIALAKTAFEEQTKKDKAVLAGLVTRERLIQGTKESVIELEEVEKNIAALVKENNVERKEELADLLARKSSLENLHIVEARVVTRTGKVRKDNTAELLAQIAALERKNALDALSGERAKAELKDEHAFIDALEEAEKFEKKGLDTAFLKAKLLANELEYKQDIALIDADEADARFRVEMAKGEIALLKEITEEGIVRLELAAQLADLKHTMVEGEERSLLIEAAKIDAAIQLRDIEQERVEQMMTTMGQGIGDAFSEGAGMLQQMDSDLASLNRPERFENVISGFKSMSAAIPAAATAFAKLGDASLSAGEKVAGGITAGLGAIGPSVAGFVSGTKEKAIIMAAFELAMGFATMFTNTAESVSHFSAAAMFGAMAGTAATMPTTAVAKETPGGGGGLITPAADPQEMEAQRITVNFGPGMIMGLPQELGRAISEQINSMAGTGMESTAF
tara:strand:+ start:3922 stop:6450 length:2529 start_codon:yes stop_codon:yes gene_type:complete